ncbi:hypothetical protein F7725_023456 [Dissostichus mawsoni]|uniref:Uncharacterized protein n=1 Tax=Dissostichus mawsoni TaxID=36200 RepID=A0A7J5Z2R1_DISMA|nr:hypothetical protein F7725_023456 [Dissostichus mawsoni]
MLKRRLPRCLAWFIRAPEGSCGSSSRGRCSLSTAALKETSLALSSSSVALTVSERAAISLLTASIFSSIILLFCFSSSLSAAILASSSSSRNWLEGGSDREDRLLQSGHSLITFPVHQLCRQSLQKLWLQDRTTGSLKTPWQTEQQKSSSNLEAIYSPTHRRLWRLSCTLIVRMAPHPPPWTLRLTQNRPQNPHTGLLHPSTGQECAASKHETRSPDISDEMKRKQVVAIYTCRRRTNWWPLALFHNLVEISHYNAYQQKPYGRRLFIEEVGEMLVTPHIKERGRLPRSSAAATIVSDLQGAAAGPSLISEWKGRRQCHFCMDRIRRVCSTCCKCGNFTCKVHSLSFAAPARPELYSHNLCLGLDDLQLRSGCHLVVLSISLLMLKHSATMLCFRSQLSQRNTAQVLQQFSPTSSVLESSSALIRLEASSPDTLSADRL